MTNSKNRAELKAQLKAKTATLVSRDKELFANLSKSEITEIKKERANEFRDKNRELIDELKTKENEGLSEIYWKLNKEDVETLIENSWDLIIIEDNFKKIKLEEFDKEEIENLMLNVLDGYLGWKKYIYNIRWDVSSIIERLYQSGKLVSYFINNMVKIKWIDHKKLVENLIKYGAYKPLLDNLEKLEWIDRKEIVDMLMEVIVSEDIGENNFDLLSEIANHLEKLEWVINHKKLAELMTCHFYVINLVHNLEKFEWIDYKKLAEDLIKKDLGCRVADYIDKFIWVDRKEVADKIMKIDTSSAGKESLLGNLKKFDWVIFNKEKSEEMFQNLLDKFRYALDNFYQYWQDQDEDDDFDERLVYYNNVILSMIDNLEKFEWLNHQELAERLIEYELADIVAQKIEKFIWVDHKKLAELIVKSGYWGEVIMNIENFPWVTENDIEVWFKEYQEIDENWAY